MLRDRQQSYYHDSDFFMRSLVGRAIKPVECDHPSKTGVSPKTTNPSFLINQKLAGRSHQPTTPHYDHADPTDDRAGWVQRAIVLPNS